MPQHEDDRWKCFFRYNHIWPKKQSVYISDVCETEKKDVLYIVFPERATPAYMQAASSVKCRKKNTVRSSGLILSYLQISPKEKTILHNHSLPKIRRALLQTSKSSILLTKPLRSQLSNRTLDLRIRLSHRHNSTSMPSRLHRQPILVIFAIQFHRAPLTCHGREHNSQTDKTGRTHRQTSFNNRLSQVCWKEIRNRRCGRHTVESNILATE